MFADVTEEKQDFRIGKIRIRISTLESNRVYKNSYPLLVLSRTGLKKMGEIELAVRFACPSLLPETCVAVYGQPLLPRMHYLRPLGVAQQEALRRGSHHAWWPAWLARSEPPLGPEVVRYMLNLGLAHVEHEEEQSELVSDRGGAGVLKILFQLFLNSAPFSVFVTPNSGKVELEYLNGLAGISGGIGLIQNDALRRYEPIANLSGVIGRGALFSFGTDLAFDISTGQFNKFNAGLSLNSDFVNASLSLDGLDSLKAACHCLVNPLTKTAIAAELKHSFSGNDTALVIGAQHAFAPPHWSRGSN
ncbi:hypothetical protein J5N97_000242 [Dioscorea zingiberensis]|uniref:Uncharacterized protein n=1 Tax=Dioscorea zingiberensis TaxID=325984 RepID=A0A9D5H1Q3_9LILI|nr:hypothetical protein J5N97_000242 [Dioscorea zingiberensis]